MNYPDEPWQVMVARYIRDHSIDSEKLSKAAETINEYEEYQRHRREESIYNLRQLLEVI